VRVIPLASCHREEEGGGGRERERGGVRGRLTFEAAEADASSSSDFSASLPGSFIFSSVCVREGGRERERERERELKR
jgi:hypothetical protein